MSTRFIRSPDEITSEWLSSALDRPGLEVARVEQMSFGEGLMSITTYLDDFDADLETKRVLGVALERTRVSLGLDKFPVSQTGAVSG